VTVRSGDRWRVSLLASAAEYGRLAAGAAEPDWDRLAGTGQPAAAGAASPEAAVTALVEAAGQGQRAVLERLSPAEQGVLAAYGPLLDQKGVTPSTATVRVDGLETRTEPLGGDVARVEATAGRLVGPMLREPVPLGQAAAKGQAPSVVTIRRDGTWYPSLVFTATDWMLTRAEGTRP
jgi:hypothetical protein